MRELRQELARRKTAGEKDIFIRRGQIVKKTSTTQNSGSDDSNTIIVNMVIVAVYPLLLMITLQNSLGSGTPMLIFLLTN